MAGPIHHKEGLTLEGIAAREAAGITVESELELEGQLAESNAARRRLDSQTSLMLSELSSLESSSCASDRPA
jgi:hypothetical protein